MQRQPPGEESPLGSHPSLATGDHPAAGQERNDASHPRWGMRPEWPGAFGAPGGHRLRTLRGAFAAFRDGGYSADR
jgi:hypothetical protein